MFWLALGYPLLAHLSVVFDDPRLQWLALLWVIALSMWGALRARRGWAWAVLVASAALLYWLVVVGRGIYALFVPPALIPASLLMLFARTLRPGEVPIIEKIATAMRGEPLPPVLVVYTRHVTQMWCGVFIFMVLSAIGFAIWAPLSVWSLMTNVVHYLILAGVFVVEFAYRRIRFSALEPWGMFEYFKRLVRTNIRM